MKIVEILWANGGVLFWMLATLAAAVVFYGLSLPHPSKAVAGKALAVASNYSPDAMRRTFERTTPTLPDVVSFLEEVLPRLRAAAAEGDFLVGWPLLVESRYFGDPADFRRIMLRIETLAESRGSQRADEIGFFYGNGDDNDLRTVKIGASE